MRIARFSLGVAFVVALLAACVGGPGPIGEDPFGQGSSSQTGQGKDKDDKDDTDPPNQTNPPNLPAFDASTRD